MKKLAIVGSGTETREQAPFDDKTFDIWVFNEAPMSDWCKRWTASFQLHKPNVYEGHNTKQADYWKWLQVSHGKTVYMQEMDARVPDCAVYPLQDVLGQIDHQYLTGTICDALGLAILQGYEHIEVWGVELSATEYGFMAECWRFWVGFAIGRLGKEHVILHSGNQLFEAMIYGYEGSFQIPAEYFSKRVEYLDNTWQSANKQLENQKKYALRCIEKGEHDKAKQAISDYQDKAFDIGQLAGALAEAEKYSAYANDRDADRNAFEIACATANKDGDEALIEMHQKYGAVEYIWNVWKQTDNVQAENQMIAFIKAMAEKAEEAGAYRGAYTENVGYMKKYDDVLTANGGKVQPINAILPEMVK